MSAKINHAPECNCGKSSTGLMLAKLNIIKASISHYVPEVASMRPD